jgi:hypothetical protein
MIERSTDTQHGVSRAEQDRNPPCEAGEPAQTTHAREIEGVILLIRRSEECFVE